MKNQEAVKLINTILDSEKLSKSALAEKIGVSKQYISQIFKGEKNIGINTLAKIKEHFPKYLDDKIDVPDKLNKDSFVSLRKQIGYTQSKLAEALGISQAIVAKYELGERNIPDAISEKLRQLVSGHNNKSEATSRHINIPYRPEAYLSSSYNGTHDKKASSHVCFDVTLLTNKQITINPSKCEILSISGDSLLPEYREGDKIILDRSYNQFIDGYLFVFIYNNQCYVRKIELAGDKIKCIPLNKKQDTFYLDQNLNYTVLGLIVPRIRL